MDLKLNIAFLNTIVILSAGLMGHVPQILPLTCLTPENHSNGCNFQRLGVRINAFFHLIHEINSVLSYDFIYL